jgi:exo-beta-1,3-glucanase (GH17 family)
MRLKLFALALCLLAGCSADRGQPQTAIPVELVETATGYQLLRGGEPYEIRGAGMPVDDLERFAAHGGNSIRTWTTINADQDTLELLDSALVNGVTVALNLPVGSERLGFDYADPAAVAAQLDEVTQEVLKYRDHPALLFWIIGNELNHSYTDHSVYDAVNEIARIIDELDPNHPTTTTVADFDPDVAATIRARAPELDFISFQVYGRLFALVEEMERSDFDGPFMVTEWGAIGYWEMESTDWGAPVEMTSTEKAETFLRGYRDVLSAVDRQLAGSYVFLWGQKQERTPTWFGMFTVDDRKTEVVDVMHFIWSGSWPENRAPQVRSMLLDGRTSRDSIVLRAGETYEAVLEAEDPERGPLSFHWEVAPESDATVVGGDFEASIAALEGVLTASAPGSASLTAPAPGEYRLFAYAYDDNGNAAHANIPFRVDTAIAQEPEDLVAGQAVAVAYSGYREGQHPDRGAGAINPSETEILEDLEIMLAHDFDLIRMYDAGDNTRATLELIRRYDLPIRVLLGIWLKGEISNHLANEWLEEPIPEQELFDNARWNEAEVERGIALAREFDDIVVAVNVGNEALVGWTDHLVGVDRVIEFVRQVRGEIEQPLTVAENYDWWAHHGTSLARELDFIGVHTYPIWENKSIDEALPYTLDNLEAVRAALPDKPMAILEAGWTTVASEFGDRANERDQLRYFRELSEWATAANVTVFFFEAFDEPWKGDENNPAGAEKHWGLFNVDRAPKQAMRPGQPR